MKFSRYNNIVFYEGSYIFHNGITGNILILEKELYDILNKVILKKKPLFLKEIHESFYNSLFTGGFLVDKNRDELQTVLDTFNSIRYDDTHFEVQINPTMNCNFKCWYCYETHIKKSRLSDDTIEKIKLLLNNIIKQNERLKTFQLSWFGGEPLLYFDSTVEPILEYSQKLFSNKNISFNSSFTSNGLLINDKVITACKKYNVTSFQITLDGYRDRHNKVRFVSKKRGSYDEIVKNIKLLIENGIWVNVRINCSEETLEGLEKISEDFFDVKEDKRKILRFDFHDVWQNEKNLSNGVLLKYMDLFRSQGFLVFSLNLNVSKNMCYADKKNMVNINYDGNLFKCTAKDFTKENSEGLLSEEGMLIWNDKHDKRLNEKYKNDPCLKCSYLPICGAGCSQIPLEKKEAYCIYDFSEEKKKNMLLNNILASMANSKVLESI